MNIQQKVSLAEFTTFKIGGEAEFFVEVKSKDELFEAVNWAKENDKKISVLGGGSNLLINSNGVEGLVIRPSNREIVSSEEGKLNCGAGAGLIDVFSFAKKNNLTGFEWAIGIPRATVGGSIRGNAEAFGVTIGELVERIEVFDFDKNEFYFLSKAECDFGYRNSLFKKNKNLLIWNVEFSLKKESKEKIDELIKKTIEHRSRSYPKFPNAGSIFQNSVSFEELKKNNEQLANYIIENGIKTRLGNVGVGFLIDYLELKGKKMGGAQISEKHGNFIINTGNATSDDVIMLISYIKQQVRDKLGIQLKEEIQLFGF